MRMFFLKLVIHYAPLRTNTTQKTVYQIINQIFSQNKFVIPFLNFD